jgi:cytochrome c553
MNHTSAAIDRGGCLDREVADLAAYYAHCRAVTPQLPGLRIVIYGAPLRGIAPCGSCHGSLNNKAASPWLEAQSEPCMKAQLQAFGSKEHRDDIS